jgi:hypothetical protein
MPNAIVMTGYGPPEVLRWAGVHRRLESRTVHERIIRTLE